MFERKNVINKKTHQYNIELGVTVALQVSAFILGLNLIIGWLSGEIIITSSKSLITGLCVLILMVVTLIDFLIIEWRFVKNNPYKNEQN